MKSYSVRGLVERLYVDGDDEAQMFSAYEKQEDGFDIWLADFYRREDAELFASLKAKGVKTIEFKEAV